jgi:hypothetical protein
MSLHMSPLLIVCLFRTCCSSVTLVLHGGVYEHRSLYIYDLRSVKHYQWLVYPPRLTVELGSYVDGEAHGWAR